MAEPEALTIIPARGGSERLPGKNVAPLAGKPLISWTIEASLLSRRVRRTVVSTDDAEIARISRECGAEVIERPAEISGSSASSESALRHALDHLKATEGYRPDLVVFLQATSPLRRPGDIDGAVETLIAKGADSLLSVARLPGPGFLWRESDGDIRPVNYDPAQRPRSQDMAEKFYVENGSIYVFRPAVLETTGCRLGGKIAHYPQSLELAFEIDDADDLDLISRLAPAIGVLSGKTT